MDQKAITEEITRIKRQISYLHFELQILLIAEQKYNTNDEKEMIWHNNRIKKINKINNEILELESKLR